MKFGRLLRDAIPEQPDVENLFKCYKKLKKLIKKLDVGFSELESIASAAGPSSPVSSFDDGIETNHPGSGEVAGEAAAAPQGVPEVGSSRRGGDVSAAIRDAQEVESLRKGDAATGESEGSGRQRRRDHDGGACTSPLPPPDQPETIAEHQETGAQQQQKKGEEQLGDALRAPLAAEASSPAQDEAEPQDDDSPEDRMRQFVQALSANLANFNHTFLEKEENAMMWLDQLEEACSQELNLEEAQSLHQSLVEFHAETLMVMHWSITAYTCAVKILKKHQKRTGICLQDLSLINLMSQPFCSTEQLTLMLRKAEEKMEQLKLHMTTLQLNGNVSAAMEPLDPGLGLGNEALGLLPVLLQPGAAEVLAQHHQAAAEPSGTAVAAAVAVAAAAAAALAGGGGGAPEDAATCLQLAGGSTVEGCASLSLDGAADADAEAEAAAVALQCEASDKSSTGAKRPAPEPTGEDCAAAEDLRPDKRAATEVPGH